MNLEDRLGDITGKARAGSGISAVKAAWSTGSGEADFTDLENSGKAPESAYSGRRFHFLQRFFQARGFDELGDHLNVCRVVFFANWNRVPKGTQRLRIVVRGAGGRVVSKRAVNQNVVPLPWTLDTPISPPLKFASHCDITKPNPVQPSQRVIPSSAWTNGLKSRVICSGEIPIPVPLTSVRMRAPLFSSTWTHHKVVSQMRSFSVLAGSGMPGGDLALELGVGFLRPLGQHRPAQLSNVLDDAVLSLVRITSIGHGLFECIDNLVRLFNLKTAVEGKSLAWRFCFSSALAPGLGCVAWPLCFSPAVCEQHGRRLEVRLQNSPPDAPPAPRRIQLLRSIVESAQEEA